MFLDCATRYPLLFLHGVGFNDRMRSFYWGRIPGVLKKRGARVFFGGHDAWGTFEDNARQIAGALEKALAKTGCEKVNIIAHSKGGIDARYLISSMGADSKVASLTTISTPHCGSKTLGDFACKARPMFRLISPLVNGFFRLSGDVTPDFFGVCRAIAPQRMGEFNRQNPDAPGVYYQHYAALMSSTASDAVFSLTHFIIRAYDGENDGIVAVSSVPYGRAEDFKGILYTRVRRGVSHSDATDYRRRPFLRASQVESGGSTPQTQGAECAVKSQNDELATPPLILVNNMCDFYVDLVANLKASGL